MAEDKKAENKGEKKAGGGNKLMLIVIILLVLVLAAVGGLAAYMFTNMNKPHGAEAAAAEQSKEKTKKKKKEGPPIFEKLETFVVNLSGGDGSLLQVDMQAELADEEAKKKFTDYMPKIRSAMILLLSSKSAAELSTPDGKVKLRAQVKQIINESMDAAEEEPVESINFTSFIIQKQ